MTDRYLMTMIYLIVMTCTAIQGPLRANPNTSNDFFVLNDTLWSGIGAELSVVLGALDAYEKGSFAGLEIELNSGLFFDRATGTNWWNYFFAPICQGDKYSHPHHHSSVEECCALSARAYNQLSRQQNYELIQKYIHVNPTIQNMANVYVYDHFNGHFVIGIHHRGTDKVAEAQMVPWELTLKVLQHTIEHLPQKDLKRLRIYVATDDQNFLDYLLHFYSSHIIYGDFFRSSDNKPLHYDEYYSNNYEKGREAIVEALILSRCNALIRPAPSGFSWIPMVFNPTMPVNSIYSGGWIYPGSWSPHLKELLSPDFIKSTQ